MLTSSRGVVLRPIGTADLDFIVSLRNDLPIERAAGRQPPMPRGTAEFAAQLADPARWSAGSDGNTDSLEFLCEIQGERAGVGGLYTIDYWARHAELGVSLAEGPWRGQGFGMLIHRMLIRYAFRDLNLRRIHASVHSDNVTVLRLCEKLGFHPEGVRKEFRWVNGHYVDLHLLSMGRGEYVDASDCGTGRAD